MISWDEPRLWLFDCDGVILDSNSIKTEIFREIAEPHGSAAADALVAHHRSFGGVSRYAKWRHFFESILGMPDAGPAIADAIDHFGRRCTEELGRAAVDPTLTPLLEAITASRGRSYVISGADQTELRSLLSHHGLAHHFTDIFGSPSTKDQILTNVLAAEPDLGRRAILLGDSLLDIDTALDHDIETVFVSHWTEVHDWDSEMLERSVPTIHCLADIALPRLV